MGYTVIDILDKLIIIEKKGYEMYHGISMLETIDEKIKVVARILADQELKHMSLYQKIKETVEKGVVPSIDFDLYDQASQLLSSAMQPSLINIVDIKQLLEFSLDFEEQNLALVIRIQGLLVRMVDKEKSVSYQVLTEIIREEKRHIREIRNFIR